MSGDVLFFLVIVTVATYGFYNFYSFYRIFRDTNQLIAKSKKEFNASTVDYENKRLVLMRSIKHIEHELSNDRNTMIPLEDLAELSYDIDIDSFADSKVKDPDSEKEGLLFKYLFIVSGKSFYDFSAIDNSLAFMPDYIDIGNKDNLKEDMFFPDDISFKKLKNFIAKNTEAWSQIFNFHSKYLINNKILSYFEKDITFIKGCSISDMNQQVKDVFILFYDLKKKGIDSQITDNEKIEALLKQGYILSVHEIQNKS